MVGKQHIEMPATRRCELRPGLKLVGLVSAGLAPFELGWLFLAIDQFGIGHCGAFFLFGAIAAFGLLICGGAWIETLTSRLYFENCWVGLSSAFQKKRCRLEDLRDVRFAYYGGLPLYAFWRRDGKLAWNHTSYGWSGPAIEKFAADLGLPFIRVTSVG
jgi:hypothetical protein